MANTGTTILLREDIEDLGGRGEIVKVKAGFARNYLLPKGLATLATKGNVRQIELERAALLKKAAAEKATAELQADQMKDITLAFVRKAGETGQLFGSVTSMDIADALKAQGYETDRRKIVLKDAIKETGEYTVRVKLHRDVTLQVPVTVRPELFETKEERQTFERPEVSKEQFIQATESSELIKTKHIKAQEIESSFIKLAHQWYEETLHSSAYLDKIHHPAYQQIIGLGKDVIPLILNELQDEPVEWFSALRALTGEDPTTPEQAGKKDEMAKAWLNWGKEKGHI